MNQNTPDDWGNHFTTCPAGHRYHKSEGGCGQCDILREKAAERHCKCGYMFQPDEFTWSKDDECWFAMCPMCEEEVWR